MHIVHMFVGVYMYIYIYICCAVFSRSVALCNPRLAHQASLSIGILQVSILQWIAVPSFRGSSQPRA